MFDRWLASSLLQKSIRRDKPDLAWLAASYLLENYPAYFWRRLPIIALEDIGVGDLDVTMMAILAGSNTRLRVELGGCLLAATALIELMCAATKDRSTDDLFDVVSRSPNLREERIATFEAEQLEDLFKSDPPGGGVLNLANLMFVQAGSIGDLPASAIKKKIWADVIHRNASDTTPMGLAETSLLGLKTTGSILAPMLFAVGCHADTKCPETDDALPDSPTGTAIPTWAMGQHTRVGLDGFRRYIGRSQRIHDFLSDTANGSVSRPKTIGGLVYRLDCGQLSHRRDCKLAADLKHQATHLGWGIPDEAVADALSILRDEFDLVNACRAEALRAYLT
ncbi:hypothetical protein C1J02_09125 [Sulfitobacter sp. SK011]|nr:hypothetical protein C1J02_09125 [Sulfitobacter sp. SK011]